MMRAKLKTIALISTLDMDSLSMTNAKRLAQNGEVL
jgi:hypothetical protein